MKAQVNITSGEFDILDSGAVIQFKDEPVEFQVATNIRIKLRFTSNKNSKDVKMTFENAGESKIDIVLCNFNNSLGSGNTEPLNLGTVNNRALYFSFRVFALNNLARNRTIHYTWYLGEKV